MTEVVKQELFTDTDPFLKVFGYRGNDISFVKKDGYYLINATQMGQAFGKVPKDYLRTAHAKELLSVISDRQKCPSADLLIVTKGGDAPQGTWMHEDLALDFAQWLDTPFRLWCNDRIKELLNHGFTATPDKLSELADNPDLLIELATKLKQEREEKAKLQATLTAQAPTMKFVETVFETESLVDVGEAAKLLKLPYGRNTLFSVLRDREILMKDNEPYQTYVDRGYFVLNEVYIQHLNKVKRKTLVTQKGLAWLDKILKAND